MKNLKEAMEWLRRAGSNLARAKSGRITHEILYEDLCFDAQQALEKALKSLYIAPDFWPACPNTKVRLPTIRILHWQGESGLLRWEERGWRTGVQWGVFLQHKSWRFDRYTENGYNALGDIILERNAVSL